MLREMALREIKRVQQGLDPKGVMRNPAENVMIDTNLEASLHGPESRHQLRVPPQEAQAQA